MSRMRIQGTAEDGTYHDSGVNPPFVIFDEVVQKPIGGPFRNKEEAEGALDSLQFTDNNIAMYFDCALCAAERPDGVSPREFRRIEAGWTKEGFQVWCVRHECNIIHIDFEGAKHPGSQGRLPRVGDEIRPIPRGHLRVARKQD